ncbi:MAG: CpsD/CapB family tyrosine-protein kinase [Gammaproteobacteria bacterium]|nr:CpsD/CapB family tyrosine-protein kinase [Gammaproteobacteria bacterium]
MELIHKLVDGVTSVGGAHRIVRDNDTGQCVTYTQTQVIKPAPETLRRNRVLGAHDVPAVRQAYKMLRTQVVQSLRAQGWSSLIVTSPGVGEGKSLTAANLAIALAREVNHTVLLVDLDLRRPAIAGHFGYEPLFGLRDYLLDDVPLNEILFNPDIERLVVLPGGKPLDESSELLTAPKMVRLAQELKTRYDGRIVIYDMPPLLLADDVLAFAPNIDAALLVIEEGRTRKDELTQSIEMLRDIPVIGTVLNKAKNARAAYY